MYLEDVVSAMKTLPVEGYICQTRKTGLNACTQMHNSLKQMIGCVERNLDERNSDAHRELASVNMSSRSPTNVFLVCRGEAFVCRCHENHLGLKSAQISLATWITWDNSSFERKSTRHTLFSKMTKMLRASCLKLSSDEDGAWFVKCSYSGHNNVGVPCGCFFAIAKNAGVPEEDIANLCMISPKYLRCWQTHYGTQLNTGQLLYQAQTQAFIDKKKGIRLSNVVADHFLKAKNQHGSGYSRLGLDTVSSHYSEAFFMIERGTCTRSDIMCFHNQIAVSNKRGPSSHNTSLGEHLPSSDVELVGKLSSSAKELHDNLEKVSSPLLWVVK